MIHFSVFLLIFAANLQFKSEMTKNLLKKITTPNGILSVNDLTADEKKSLYAEIKKLGSSENFAYKRLFQDGFAEWEIAGVNDIKIQFIEWLQIREKIYIEVREVGECTWRHFYRVPPRADENQTYEEYQFDINKAGDFWRFLGDIGYRKRFGDMMAQMGMRSYNTVMKRFADDDWREWERCGIRRVITKWLDT